MPTSFNSTLQRTDFDFAGQTDVYHGKVRDVYSIDDKYLVMIATDRISAFDRILPRQIPCKGQVLNQTASYFLKATSDIAPNWLISTPDQNVCIGYKCEPFKVELVVRKMLVGHSWREYESGKRKLCGQTMPDGLRQFDLFPEPIITPTTKADAGHDEDISKKEIIQKKLASEEQYDQMCSLALRLFAKGQQMASEKGLLLADTKYEFGLLNGKIVLIDEIHTPDSSRYFYLESHENFIKGRSDEAPRHLSKEFLRDWLLQNGFSGKSGQQVPEMTDELVDDISQRYIELYEKITGISFIPSEEVDIVQRIEDNINKAIKELE